MGQNKLKRFADIATFKNVYEYPEGMKGKWHETFKNNNPITLELACGKGEYTVGLALMYADRNLIGVDVKGNRIWVGAKKLLENNLTNACFLRTQIGMIENYFGENEIDEIWLTFPDPQLRISNIRRRLTHPIFLRKYKKFLKPDATIHLKTDSPTLFAFTKKVIELYGLNLLMQSNDISIDMSDNQELKIKTHYEGLDIAKSKRIHYLQFSLTENISESIDDDLKNQILEMEMNSEESSRYEKRLLG